MSAAGRQSGWGVRTAAAILAFWALVALLAPLIAPHSQNEVIARATFAPLGKIGWLGTDYFGRDMLSRLIFGARTTLSLALTANLIASGFGILTGFGAAFSAKWIDEMLSRIFDGLLAFPTMMFALVCVSALGSSILILVFTVGFIESIRVFRIARAVGADYLTRDYVSIARARGERRSWILSREVLPNALPPLLTDFGMRFSATVLLLSAISFLGLGVQPPTADWGIMVNENLGGLRRGAFACILPALAIFSVTCASNILVDWYLRRTQRDISTELLA